MGDERWAIILYARATAVVFINALTVTTAQEPELSFADDPSSADEDDDNVEDEGDEFDAEDEDLEEDVFRPWYDVLGVSPSATRAQIKAAYRDRLKEYHPDRVAHLGEKLRDLANNEATAINKAYAEARRLGRI